MTAIVPARNYGLDILRVLSCYMVIQAHAGEFYYIGNGEAVLNTADAHLGGWLNSLCISSVPMFVMLSGFFLFPVKDTPSFFKKRLSRVAIPFVLWCVFYALYAYLRGYTTLNASIINVIQIPVNYGAKVGHLWFVYMLIGIYLFAPVISPWVQTASRKSMELYLILWTISLTLPYLHLIFPEIWGEAFWNHTPMLYYFSGFLGYVMLANYIKRFHMDSRRWHYVAGIALLIIGYLVTTLVFLHRLDTEKWVKNLILSWSFDTINIAMMAAGLFLLFKNVHFKNTNSFPVKLLGDMAAKSYGIYLAHIIVLNAVHSILASRLTHCAVKIPIIGICAFIITYFIIKALSYLPYSKWITG
ncbi:acyltransferase [Mucilaginibacter gotjawali]|uniref:Surface polysaccharide O-acyltransferase-like enzyme n=1 Tax=Mucilaginibacter gotjawali TaxID=1550579 RepID=A0A839SNP1_9SPHI|nr:acyltransferase family protein [Mucilaginibacter gotjawali]MBB3058948.1 surface polysaccharide O-acyltransferase-like enzyme [Mucilaginibacter gotjawali]